MQIKSQQAKKNDNLSKRQPKGGVPCGNVLYSGCANSARRVVLSMADTVTPEKRSEIMSKIRSRNTKPEMLVRRYLFRRGFRFRVNDRRLPGTPDVVLPKYRTVVFVNGCFWHGHGCKLYVLPKTNIPFWKEKIRRNRDRDDRNRARLEALGWRVIVVWECELRTKSLCAETLEGLVNEIWEA